MRTEEYLRTLTDQIRCKMAREEIAEEMSGHIEDQTRAFMSEGMERGEAEVLAVREMGDPVDVGTELDKIHRPRMPWGMIGMIFALSVIGYTVICLFYTKCVDSAGDPLLESFNIGRQLLFMLAGLAVMTGVCFADYTRIAGIARQTMAVLLIASVIGTKMSGVMVNGALWWVDLQVVTVNVILLLLLTVPLYAGILYDYRGSGRSGVIKAVLWMLPGCCITMLRSGAWMALILMLTYLVIFEITVYKGWYRISKRTSVIAGWAVGAGLPCAALLWLTCFSNPYQQERLAAIFGVGGGFSYFKVVVGDLLKGSRLIGRSSMISDTVCVPGDPAEMALAGVAGYYGILAAAALAGAILFLFLWFLRVALKQRNQLGMLMGTGCAAVFLILAGIYFANNLGIMYLGTYCPFLSMGGSGTIVVYILLGLMLSICRHRNTAPERYRKIQKELDTAK